MLQQQQQLVIKQVVVLSKTGQIYRFLRDKERAQKPT